MIGNVALSNSFQWTITHMAIIDLRLVQIINLCEEKWPSKLVCSNLSAEAIILGFDTLSRKIAILCL